MTSLRSIWVAASCVVLSAACGGGTVGSTVSFSWRLGAGVTCADAGIDTIRARVINAQSKKDVLTPAPTFQCGVFTGNILNVAAGTYNLTLEGILAAAPTSVVWTATVSGLTIKSGEKTTAVGLVRLAKIPPTVNPSALQASWRFSDGRFCTPNGVAQVRITAWRDRAFLEHDKTYDCDNGSAQIALPPGVYSVIAEAINATGVVVTEAQQDNVNMSTGGASTEFVLQSPGSAGTTP
jgi:hypothetical protein